MIMIEPVTLILSAFLAAQAQDAGTAETPTVEAPAQVAVQEEEEVDDDDKIICKRTAVIGSKFKKQICGTQKQWATLESRSTETTREWQRRGKGLEPNDVNKPGT